MILINAIEIKVKYLVYYYKMHIELNQLKLWLKKLALKLCLTLLHGLLQELFSSYCPSLICGLLPRLIRSCLVLSGSCFSEACYFLKGNVGEVVLEERGEGAVRSGGRENCDQDVLYKRGI